MTWIKLRTASWSLAQSTEECCVFLALAFEQPWEYGKFLLSQHILPLYCFCFSCVFAQLNHCFLWLTSSHRRWIENGMSPVFSVLCCGRKNYFFNKGLIPYYISIMLVSILRYVSNVLGSLSQWDLLACQMVLFILCYQPDNMTYEWHVSQG